MSIKDLKFATQLGGVTTDYKNILVPSVIFVFRELY